MTDKKIEFRQTFQNLKCYYVEIEDEILYFDYNEEKDKLQLGGVTNRGFYPTFGIDIDYDFDLDGNLEGLIEAYNERKTK